MKSDIFIIGGDSWGAGIFDKTTHHGFTHGGITKCMIDRGQQVRNLCQPGGSNLSVIERIKNYLICNDHEINNIKGIIFWQIEFFKDFNFYKDWQIVDELAKGYDTLKNQWIYRPYYALSDIAQHWNIPVYVLGGSSDTVQYDNFELDFPGVQIVCHSVTNYVLSESADQPVHAEFISSQCEHFIAAVKKKISTKNLQILLEDIDLGHQRLQKLIANPQLFFPDGIHPNQTAHDLVYKLLEKHVPELG